MYGKTQFNKTAFNTAAGDPSGLYVTIQNEYGMTVPVVKVKARMPSVTMPAVFSVVPETLWIRVPLTAVCAECEYGVISNLAAKLPLGTVRIDAEAAMEAHLTVKVPLGRVTMNAVTSVIAVPGVKVPLGTSVLKSENGIIGILGVYVPMVAATLNAQYDTEGTLGVYVPLHRFLAGSQFGTFAKSLRTDESEEMNLEGLNLAPGQRLIIDTDTMEISVDDEVRVDCWVTGGSFFQLKNGINILSFTDNASSRKLKTTVLWADRYL